MREITRGLASVLGTLLLAHCSRTVDQPQAKAPASAALFSDGVHGGIPHFYLLPPIVPAPSVSGTFDPTLSPVVTVCRLAGSSCAAPPFARFSLASGTVRVDAAAELYVANWPTDPSLPDGALCRVKITVAGALLGFADLAVVASQAQAKKVDASEYFAFQDGRTIPIKFRIEKGAISLLPPSGGTAQVGPGGGAVALSDGSSSLVFPRGALSAPTSIGLAPATDWPPTQVIGGVYDLTPDGAAFAAPVTLTIAAAGIIDPGLQLSTAAPGDLWEAVAGAATDSFAHSASGPILHFSKGAVLAPVTAVSVSPASASVVAGSTVQLTATTAPPNHMIGWRSSNTAVASVGATGLVSGVAPGTASITATSGAATGTAAIGVVPPAPVIAAPAIGFDTTSTSVTIAGSGLAGAAIALSDGSASIPATPVVDSSGQWSATVLLGCGPHSLSATASLNGQTSALSNVVSGIVRPAAPAILGPADGTLTTNGSLSVSGSALPDARVDVFDGMSLIASAVGDPSGAFSAGLSLAFGVHSLAATQTLNGETSAASGTVSVVVKPPAPAVTAPATGFDTTSPLATIAGTGVAGATIALSDSGTGSLGAGSATADASGAWSVFATLGYGTHRISATQIANGQQSAPSGTVEGVVRPPAPSITSASKTLVTGIGLAGASVAILDGGTAIAAAAADPAGVFSAGVSLATGSHPLTARQSINGETSAPSGAVVVEVAPPQPGEPGFNQTGSMAVAREPAPAVQLPGGRVLVAGAGSAEVYDPATDSWNAPATMLVDRRSFGIGLLADGRVMAAGGFDSNGNVLASTELYDPATNAWSEGPPLSLGGRANGSAVVLGGKLLIAGGVSSAGDCAGRTDAEVFDATTGWTQTGSVQLGRQSPSAVVLASGKVLLAGGSGPTCSGPVRALRLATTAGAEMYDAVTRSWSPTGGPSSDRQGFTLTAFADGRALLAGGFDTSGFVATAEIYDPAAGAVSATGSLHTPRTGHTATLLSNGNVVVIGGTSATGAVLASAEIYDVSTGLWTEMP
ncbi:MAG: kelch repeat-containing protein, partial [Myxococcales bacterium]